MDGKVALITGARRGIGLTIARTFANNGARLALIDLNSGELEEAAEELVSNGVEVLALPGDVTNSEGIKSITEQVIKKWGKADILVNAAGIHDHVQIESLTTAKFKKMLDVNIMGVFHCTQAVLPYMIQQKSGSIVSVASLAGLRGHPTGASHYAASKGAVISFMRSVAREMGEYGIRANCVAPGMVDTAMIEGYTKEERENYARSIPLGRIGKPEDIADVIHFLSSDASSYVTGQVLNVCGGVLMA